MRQPSYQSRPSTSLAKLSSPWSSGEIKAEARPTPRLEGALIAENQDFKRSETDHEEIRDYEASAPGLLTAADKASNRSTETSESEKFSSSKRSEVTSHKQSNEHDKRR